MSGERYTEADARRWLSLHKKYGGTLSWREIGEHEGYTRNTVKNAALRAIGAPPVVEEPSALPEEPQEPPRTVSGVEVKGDIIFEDKRPQPTDDDVEALLQAYLQVMEKAQPLSTRQRVANVRIKGDLPIGINYFGDQHVGGWGWAARRQIEDYKLTAETDGLYTCFLGDDWDNFIFNFGKWASVMRPGHQKKIAEHLGREVFAKTLAVVGGNHIHWTSKSVDIDLNAMLAALANAVFMGHRGDLLVHVGSQMYHHYLHHRARGASTVNKTNSARVTSNDVGGADIIVEADRHDPWMHNEYHQRMKQVWLRTGTYKIDDDYTDEAGFMQGKWDMPMTILFPDQKRVVPFMDFRDGIDTLNFLRDKYRNGKRTHHTAS